MRELNKKEVLVVLMAEEGRLLELETQTRGVNDEKADEILNECTTVARAMEVVVESLMDDGVVEKNVSLINNDFDRFSIPDEKVYLRLMTMSSKKAVSSIFSALKDNEEVGMMEFITAEALRYAAELLKKKFSTADEEGLEIE